MIKQRHFSKRKKSYLGCRLCSFSCSSQNLSFNHDCRGVEGPVNGKFFCRFWAISFSTLIYILIHLNFYNTEEHLQLAQFLFCLLMFLRKTIIICQVQVNLLLVPFLDMLSSIPGVLSVYSLPYFKSYFYIPVDTKRHAKETLTSPFVGTFRKT